MTMLKCESESMNPRTTCGVHPSRKYPNPYTTLLWGISSYGTEGYWFELPTPGPPI